MSLIYRTRGIPCFEISQLDQEHQEIANLIEAMARNALALEKGKVVSPYSREEIEHIVDIFQSHFVNEEAFLQEINYPDIDQHKESHSRILEKTKATLLRQQQQEGGISIGTIVLFNGWMQNHLEEEDKKFVDYYRKRNAAI